MVRQYNVDYKLDTYLKIARLYLEDDDPVQAEAYINRASLLQNESTNEQLQVHYKVCYARVLDYRRKFIEAAQRYNELSYKSIVHETERLEALKHALHCTILASAGTCHWFVYCLSQHCERRVVKAVLTVSLLFWLQFFVALYLDCKVLTVKFTLPLPSLFSLPLLFLFRPAALPYVSHPV